MCCFLPENGLFLCNSCHSLLNLPVLCQVAPATLIIYLVEWKFQRRNSFFPSLIMNKNICQLFFLRTLGLRRPAVSSIVGVFLILAFTSHVSYLTFVSFDYGYNMAANASIGEAHIWSSFSLCFDVVGCVLNASFVSPRPGEPAVVAMLVLAEPGDLAILVEMWPGGAAASWSGLAGAAWLPPNALDPRRSCCVAPQHHTSPFPFLQVCLSLWNWNREIVTLLNCTQMVHVFSLQFSDRR